MNKYFIILIFSVLLFTLIGCSPNTITINENNQNEKYSLKKDDNIEVILAANPTTGFKWQIVNIDNSKIKLIDESYTAHKVNRDIVGSGGNKVYLFNTIDKGNTSIEFEYSRPFEKEATPYKIFNVNLDIR